MAENTIKLRAKAMFPTVLLTMLSIVQALVLELIGSHVIEQPYLYEWSFAAVLSWLQIAASLLGIFLIWLVYSDMVLRLSWTPTTTDALFPFVVGILEFTQIRTLGPDRIGAWFVILSVLFASMAWITQSIMRRARQEPDNSEFFIGINPATWRDYLLRAIPVAVLALCGVAIWLTRSQGWWVCLALVAANLLLAHQIWLNHVYTQRSYSR